MLVLSNLEITKEGLLEEQHYLHHRMMVVNLRFGVTEGKDACVSSRNAFDSEQHQAQKVSIAAANLYGSYLILTRMHLKPLGKQRHVDIYYVQLEDGTK